MQFWKMSFILFSLCKKRNEKELTEQETMEAISLALEMGENQNEKCSLCKKNASISSPQPSLRGTKICFYHFVRFLFLGEPV